MEWEEPPALEVSFIYPRASGCASIPGALPPPCARSVSRGHFLQTKLLYSEHKVQGQQRTQITSSWPRQQGQEEVIIF